MTSLSNRAVFLGCLLIFSAGLAVEYGPDDWLDLAGYVTPGEALIVIGLVALSIWAWAVWGGARIVARGLDDEA